MGKKEDRKEDRHKRRKMGKKVSGNKGKQERRKMGRKKGMKEERYE